VTLRAMQWVTMVLGGILVIVSFLMDTGAALQQQMPGAFNWLVFAAGVCVGIAGFAWALRESIRPPA